MRIVIIFVRIVSMSEILKSFYDSGAKEVIQNFIMEKEYPFFLHMCGVSDCAPTYKISRGITCYYTIEYIIRGKGYVQENDKICYPQAGDTHVFHAGSNQVFYADPSDPWLKKWIIFSGPCADSLFEVYDLNNQLLYPGLDMLEPIERISRVCGSDYPQEEIMSRCSVIVMEMIQMLYMYKLKQSSELSTLSTADRLKTIIDTMWDFDVTLDEIAAQVYCSRNHAIRIFKEKFGISPYKYISEIRLKNSKRMLKTSTLPVGEIASLLGFCDSRYFSNWFRKHTGISPKEYRILKQQEYLK